MERDTPDSSNGGNGEENGDDNGDEQERRASADRPQRSKQGRGDVPDDATYGGADDLSPAGMDDPEPAEFAGETDAAADTDDEDDGDEDDGDRDGGQGSATTM